MTEPTFETDFWKDAQSRKIWDDIVPGQPRKTLPYTLTLDAIQKYCRVVGDMHPLYFDEAFARNSPYKGLIAPPAIHILLMRSEEHTSELQSLMRISYAVFCLKKTKKQ